MCDCGVDKTGLVVPEVCQEILYWVCPECSEAVMRESLTGARRRASIKHADEHNRIIAFLQEESDHYDQVHEDERDDQ